MKLLQSLLVQITCILMALILFTHASSSMASIQYDNFSNKTLSKSIYHKKKLDDQMYVNDILEENQLNDEQLPLLSPIILLDFVHKENKSFSNITYLNDEKFKRTINENLAYGFNQEKILNGKHNFYFPIDKTGTVVSIEESISPFEPKIVTEIIKPITEQSNTNITQTEDTTYQPIFEALPDPLPLQISHEPLPIYPPYPSLGHRIKFQKTSSSNFEQYLKRPSMQQFSKLYSSIPGSDNYKKLYATYEYIKPTNHPTSSSSLSTSANVNGYVKPITSNYLNNYMSNIYDNSNNDQKSSIDKKNVRINYSIKKKDFNLPNIPRYTVENGIKYEHKIIWKYPDGKISEIPPISYANSYAEYAKKQKLNGENVNNMHLSNLYQFHPTISKQQQTFQDTNYNSYTSNVQNNVYSKKYVQFPTNKEQSIEYYEKEQNKLISSSSTVSSINDHDTVYSYNSENYQGQYGLRQNFKNNRHKFRINHKNKDNTYNNYQPTPKYIVNNSDPESNSQIKNVKENLFSANRQINKQVLSKYSPEVQNYLMKIFSSEKSTLNYEDQIDKIRNNTNTDYSYLLNYNPSIMQYIKNPSSILNAQPTFVRIGNSLIPVIILRIDGASPVQSEAGSNINLKALLQKYLTQYVTNASKTFQNSSDYLGASINNENVSYSQSNPVADLKHLTKSLESLRQHVYQNHDFLENYTRNYEEKSQSTYQENNRVSQNYITNYNQFIKDYQQIYAGQQMNKPQDKVKSVQIIENPRYTTYTFGN